MEADRVLNSFYGSHEEEQRFTSKSGAVEFLVTTSYIDRYLKPGDRIIEIGCGTGRYSLHYAGMGYEVDALELVKTNLDVLQKKRREMALSAPFRAVQGNALDLSAYESGAFDVTLLLGPMYHLFTREDKLRCLREALRVTRPGGKLFVAYCQFDASMVQTIFSGKQLFDFVVDNGLLDLNTYLPVSSPAGIFELCRKEQVDALDEEIGVARLHYVGTDMFTHYCADSIDGMSEERYRQYLAYTFTICENQNLVGVSNHTLDVLCKGASADGTTAGC